MPSHSNSLKLSENIFIILRDLIHERTGIYYDASKRDLLADKLIMLILDRGFDSFLDYYYLLKYDNDTEQEWQHLIDILSVPETFFWREFDQIESFVKILLPEYYLKGYNLEHYDRGAIQIWSAACSTGEEPLTLAIALNEAGWFERCPITIYASDASPRALTQAQKGIYRDRSLRNIPPHLKAKYFTQTPQGWRISPEIHQKVYWTRANLVNHKEITLLAHAPFIFCRNVFLYFSQQGISQTVDFFFEKMPTPSYLFIGASESLLRLKVGFKLQLIGGAFVYVKE